MKKGEERRRVKRGDKAGTRGMKIEEGLRRRRNECNCGKKPKRHKRGRKPSRGREKINGQGDKREMKVETWPRRQ